ncbi:LOB domain-containing protein [Musa troglodytarum]|uniref:LOB domain-containing protein n=1 Tax=Musa troglodytarum TaxID=320322 RepID=A0A9E7FK38_9LILI|nr:LOB domain-containing protein [Musa troglodytarum]
MSGSPSPSIGGATGGGSGGAGGGGGTSGGGGSAGGGSGPCGACKFLRRKCMAGCIFAPYFDSDQGAAHFAAVHKVFGASNVSKLLLHIPAHKRLDAVVTICYEAQARLRDPVYGCVGHIFALQQQEVGIGSQPAGGAVLLTSPPDHVGAAIPSPTAATAISLGADTLRDIRPAISREPPYCG